MVAPTHPTTIRTNAIVAACHASGGTLPWLGKHLARGWIFDLLQLEARLQLVAVAFTQIVLKFTMRALGTLWLTCIQSEPAGWTRFA